MVLSLLVLGVLSVMFVVACGGGTTTTAAPATTTTAAQTTTTGAQTTTTGGPTTSEAAQPGEDLVIGAINSMSGSNVLTGQEEKWAQEKAVADINAKGGLKLSDGKMHKLALKFVDDKSSPDEGAAAMERLIKSDGIKVVLSSNITPINQAAATVAEQYGAFYQIVSSWVDQPLPDGTGPSFIGGMKLKWSADKEQDWSPNYMFGYKGFWPVDFYTALGPDADYICYDGFWSETLPFPYAKELGAAFTADHNGATSNSIGLYYAGVQILATAIERAGVFEPGAIRDQVFGGTFPGTTMGHITYGAYYKDNPGIAHIPFLAFQWASGGKRVVLYPTQFATGKAVTFVPWDKR